MKIKDNKVDSGDQGKLWKGLLTAAIITTMGCGYLEDAETIDKNVADMFKTISEIGFPPLVFLDDNFLEDVKLTVCNVHLANTLANAIVNPLAFLVSNVKDKKLVSTTEAAMKEAVAFVADPTTAPRLVGSNTWAWGLANQAASSRHINDAKIAVAILIIASGKTAKATGGSEGLNASAIRAANICATFPPEVLEVSGSLCNANAIIATYLGVPNAVAVKEVVFAASREPAKRLWNNMIRRAHLWKVPADLQEMDSASDYTREYKNRCIDINYLAWCRGARVNETGDVKMSEIHSSFVVPSGVLFKEHFSAILAAIGDASSAVLNTPTAIQVSWQGTLNGMPPPPSPPNSPPSSPMITTERGIVNVHLDIAQAGEVMKFNPRGALLNFAVSRAERWAGEGERYTPHPPEGTEAALPLGLSILSGACSARSHFFGVLREVAITGDVLSKAPAGKLPDGIFFPLLGGGTDIASASNPQTARTVTICVSSNGALDMFPE
ncbi:MAG: hypothetical protein LBJ71_02920 [Holosporaceae bacterium]|jgi:hypothetical protein|nr:hypothetical protein [Holosporaceae bacterium]